MPKEKPVLKGCFVLTSLHRDLREISQSHTLGKTPDCAAAFGVAAADVPTHTPAAFLGCVLLVAQVVKSPAADAGD